MAVEVCPFTASIFQDTPTNTACAGAGNIGADPAPFVPAMFPLFYHTFYSAKPSPKLTLSPIQIRRRRNRA
jgi:hypothetical protein